MNKTMQTVNFTEMVDGTVLEYALLDRLERAYVRALPARLLAALEKLRGSLAGYQVSRLEHVLQSATRAYESGESEEIVVAALLHDIGDMLAPLSHSEMAAAIIRPYVSERTYWIVKHHGVFQMYYYAHHLGGERNARNKYRNHPWYQDCVNFCENYDQNCFDPDYPSKPLSFFAPMLQRVFAEPLYGFQQAPVENESQNNY